MLRQWKDCFTSPATALACAKQLTTMYPQAASLSISGPSTCGKCGTPRNKNIPYLTHVVLNNLGNKIEGGMAQNGFPIALATPMDLPPSGLLPTMIISGPMRNPLLNDIIQARLLSGNAQYSQNADKEGNQFITLPPAQRKLVLVDARYNNDIETDLMHARHVKSICGGPEYVFDSLTGKCVRIIEASPEEAQRQAKRDSVKRLKVIIEPCNALGEYENNKTTSKKEKTQTKQEEKGGTEETKVKSEFTDAGINPKNYGPDEDLLTDERKFCVPFHDGRIVGVANNDLSTVIIFKQAIPVKHIELIAERGLSFDTFPRGSGPQQEYLWKQLAQARQQQPQQSNTIDQLIWPNEQLLTNVPITDVYAQYLVQVQQSIGKSIQSLPSTCRGNNIIYERGRCRGARSVEEQTNISNMKQHFPFAQILYVRRNPKDGKRYLIAYWNEQEDFIVPKRPLLWSGQQMMDQPQIQTTSQSQQVLDTKVDQMIKLPAGTIVTFPDGSRSITADVGVVKSEFIPMSIDTPLPSASSSIRRPSFVASSIDTPLPSFSPAVATNPSISRISSIKTERS